MSTKALFFALAMLAAHISLFDNLSAADQPTSGAPHRPLLLADDDDRGSDRNSDDDRGDDGKGDDDRDRLDRRERGDDRDSRYRDREDRYDDDRRRESERGILPSGIERTSTSDARAIRDSLIVAVEAAVNKGGFDNLVGQLARNDRDRIGNYPNQEFVDLDEAAGKFQQAWREKYNKDLDVKIFTAAMDEEYGDITQGRVDDAGALKDWPIDPTTRERSGQRTTTVNLKEGDEVAIVALRSRNDLPRLKISMIRESEGKWRIDIPNTITGPELKDSLLRHLKDLSESKNSWPDSPERAYRSVAHHVLMAIYKIPTPNQSLR